jgi:hypothetical protein
MALKFAVNNSLSAVTSLPTAIPTGSMTLLQTQTASSSSTIDFTSNIDSTYDSYVFKFINIHPSVNQKYFEFQGSTDGGSNYNTSMTTTFFRAYHNEAGSSSGLAYFDIDQANGTSFQRLAGDIGSDNDQAFCGELKLYNPSSTTFVKHFMYRGVDSHHADQITDGYCAGYFNTTSAINAIQFKFDSANIDSGDIKLYGIS